MQYRRRSAGQAGTSPRSATACGAWPGGLGATTRSRCIARPGGRSSGATSSTRPGPTATGTASGCSARRCGATRTSGSTSRPRFRRRTAGGRPGASTRSTTCSRLTTSGVHREEPANIGGVDTIDLQQFHVWSDAWADDDRWQRAVAGLKDDGLRPRRRHQHQPLAAGQCAACARYRAHRRRAGRLQRLRSESRGRAVPRMPREEHRASSRACRSTKAA